jgi:putative transposase
MARLPRVVAVDTPHHVTQRGNARRFILDSDLDRRVYLQLLAENCRLYDLSLAGYCLMSNHVHLILIPHRADSLRLALKNTHGRFAAFFNARHESSGHVWQGRYYSCPLDKPHFWAALRYVERNPLRAGLVEAPDKYPWSSAAIHYGEKRDHGLVDMKLWQSEWGPDSWREFVLSDTGADDAAIRKNTHTGRPIGTPEFVRSLERTLLRCLMPSRGGRAKDRSPYLQLESFGLW